MSWFKATFTVDVSNAIERWNEAISVYTDAYGFRYLRQLHFTVSITGINATSNPDIAISFLESDPNFLGETRFRVPTPDYFFRNVTVRLATFDSTNTRQLTNVDMTNIALHEFGHALGLDHANSTLTPDSFPELMFKDYPQQVGGPNNILEEPSTLDMHALASVYSWLPGNPPSSGKPVTTITLPAGIPYSAVIPYADQLASLKTLVNQLNQRILVLAILLIILFAGTITLTILLSRKKPIPPQIPQFPPPQPPSQTPNE